MAFEDTFIQFILEYDNPSNPFAESPTRTRFFATLVEMDDFIDKMAPDLRVIKAFKQTTHIARDYYFGHQA